ncbi:dihydrofolate reductase [Dysosmobacter sp.]|uniref:dihydrofolate reductase n=1 Tax=Dysosmobacter sp. TaxID=2591382 RepID=UPI002A8D293B|nr:dihydrofolate reductase [Dysosmobacter sp.]MDY3280843.1 dihydrofolate reductase [Dysosmobacter sp.]
MNAIVAVDANWGIGRGNELLFTLRGDLKRFREITTGGTILLGRKTLETFPGGRPLPKRRNVVLTKSTHLELEGATVVHTIDELLDSVKDEDPNSVFVVGGGTVYTALLPYCKRVYMTRVDATAGEPDTYFPNLDKLPGWEVEKEEPPIEENGITYRFVDYINKNI